MGSRVLRREEARALFSALDEGHVDPDTLVDSPDVLVYDGDVDIDALHLEPYTPSVVVRGNLRVRTVLRQDPGAGPLSVLGALHAGAIATEAVLFARGDIVADELIYGRSAERGMKSLGRLQTPRLIADGGYVFAPAGGLDAGVFIDLEGDADGVRGYERALGAPVRIGRYFGADMHTQTTFEGVAAVCAKLAAGEPLLPDRWSVRPPPPPPPAPAAARPKARAPKRKIEAKKPKAAAPAKKNKKTASKKPAKKKSRVK